MITRSLLILFCLVFAAGLMLERVRAQSPADTTRAVPAAPQSTAEQIDSLLNDAIQHARKLEWEEASQSASRALSLSKSIGDLTPQLKATNILAMARWRSGQTGEAIRRFKEAAAIAAKANDKTNEALALNRVGGLLRVSGQYEEALYCFSRAINLYQQEKNRSGEVLARSSLSTVYSETGDFAQARQQLEQALPISHDLNDKVLDEALVLKLGIVEYECGNSELALKFGLEALALNDTQDSEKIKNENRRTFDQTGEIQLRTFALTQLELFLHLGNVYADLRDYQKASDFFDRALDHSRQRPLIAAISLGSKAGAQLRLGNVKEARDLAVEAIKNLRNSGGSKHWEATFLYYLAEANRALGLNDEAMVSYRQAIDAMEQARSLSIPTEVSRAGIVAARHQVFAGTIDFFLSQHREEEALAIAEAWHARAFLDILTESRIDLRKDLSPTQRDQEDKIFVRISGIQKELWSPAVAPAREQELNAELATAESALESFQLEMRRTNPRYANVKYPRPLKAEQVAKGLLGPDTALVEFVLSEPKSFAWTVFRGKVSSVILPPRKEIDDLIANYRAALSERVSALTVKSANARANILSAELYRKLFAPLETHLAGARKLVVVPDGSLLYLPFETLKREGATSDYLVERFAISYAPSATALGVMQDAKRDPANEPKGIVAFGDPIYVNAKYDSNSQIERQFELTQLPYTRSEVNGIASLFSIAERRTFFGAEAQEERVKSEDLSHSRYLHFAAHGLIDEANPMRSGIVMSTTPNSKEDGILQMNEVMRLKLNADVVTLSACRTGLGKLLSGEGMIGLTRAFQYAGANSVVVSLWNVNDIATAELMKAFYQNLTHGLPRDEALRQAKLSLLHGKQRTWEHPYFWAAFVLVGADN